MKGTCNFTTKNLEPVQKVMTVSQSQIHNININQLNAGGN